MAVYDGFFDAVLDDETEKYDRAYESGDFTGYFEKIIGTGVCVHGNENSFKVRLENGKAVVSPGYLFIQGYWCKNDADYAIDLPGTGNYAIAAHLNLGQRMIELRAQSVAQAYPDSLVLAIVSPSSSEDTRHNTDICGVIDTAGALSSKVEWALNYIDTEIESKLAQVEQDIAAQSAKLDAKIAEVQAVADSIVPPPIGSIKFSASQNVGPEWLKCDGSFINEAQYPELVESLGKLIPSGDKFQLISSGEIGPQISNGVIYGGKMWVYSYSAKKLYGVDLAGTADIKEITVTSEDESFDNLKIPTPKMPIALSIVQDNDGASTLFITQIFNSKAYNQYNGLDSDKNLIGWDSALVFLSSSFSGTEQTITLTSPIQNIHMNESYFLFSYDAIPYVTARTSGGTTTYYCAVGHRTEKETTQNATVYDGYVSLILWNSGSVLANTHEVDGGGKEVSSSGTASNYFSFQRYAFSKKNQGELITAVKRPYPSKFSKIVSYPEGLYSASWGTILNAGDNLETFLPINIAGTTKVLFSFSANNYPWLSRVASAAGSGNLSTVQNGSRLFYDSTAYLWGKDIYLIFVGTGIIFSRTLETNSFGYLDTTSVLGTITQFGYLDYSQDEGTLYLLGQDTTNMVKVAKIVLNTLYNYANDGAWLPMIASDGVPAYIKAKEAET